MSLRVWLPLTGHLNNQGIDDITVINNGATVDNNGKLGKCYNFNNTSALSTHIDVSQFVNHFSFCGWVKFTSTTSAQYIFHLGGATWHSKYALSEDYSGTIVYYMDGAENRTTLSTANTLNQWVHYAYTYDGSTVKIYVNGVLGYTASKSPSSFSYSDNLTFGARVNNSAGTAFAYGMQNGYLNDVRIYDHALSPKEIKLLSQGLVAHYKLDNNGNGGDNIIPGTSPNEVQYTYPSTSYSDKFYKTSTVVPSASQYVLSFWAKSTNSGDKVRAHWYSPNTTTGAETSQGVTSTASDGTIDFTLSDQWEKYWCVWTQSATTSVKHFIFPRMFSQASGQATGTGTVSVKCVKLEEGNQPTAWCPNATDSSYSTLGYNSILNYDVSGNDHNGTNNGTFEYNSDTVRYSISTKYTGSNYISVTSPSAEVKTISFWAKWDSIPSGQSILFVDYKSRLGFGLMSKGILCGSVTGTYYTFSKSSIVANTWYHFVVINPDNSTRKLYINGVEQTATTSMDVWSYNIDQLQIGKRSTSSDGFVGNMSDFRVYATALSAEDIQQLYNAPVSVTNTGAMLTQGEFVEVVT